MSRTDNDTRRGTGRDRERRDSHGPGSFRDAHGRDDCDPRGSGTRVDPARGPLDCEGPTRGPPLDFDSWGCLPYNNATGDCHAQG